VYVKASNKSYFDVKYSDFGTQGQDWIPSGTEYLLEGAIANNGKLTVTPVNSDNISNPAPGTLLINEFLEGEDIPKGAWPVSIPKSTVISLNTIATILQNLGNPQTTIAEGQPNGDINFPFTLDNFGNLSLGDPAHPGSINLYGGTASFGGSSTFDALIGPSSAIHTTGQGQFQMNDTGPVLGGTTAGSVLYILPFQGFGLKIFAASFVGYNNTTATKQTITLPQAFNQQAFFWIGGILSVTTSGVNFTNNGAIKNTNYVKNGVTTINSSAAAPCYCVGEVNSFPFNRIDISASLTGPNGVGGMFVVGF
jgi:hypothetical protein